MNKNLVLISSIGLFLADVRNPLRSLFLASHIVYMRPCKTLGMEEWLMRPSYSFSTSVGEAKSTCSVLGFDSHFQNSSTILFRYYKILFQYYRIAFIWYCKQCLPLRSSGTVGKTLRLSSTVGEGLGSSGTVGKTLRSSVTMGEGLRSSGTGQKSSFIWYCRRGYVFIRYWEKLCVHLVLVKDCVHSVLGKNKYAFFQYWAKEICVHLVLRWSGTGNEVLVVLILISKFLLLDLNASSNRTYKLNIFSSY
jgi:hypothetical protein